METIKVYQCELNDYIDLEYIGKVKYIGDSFYGLTNECIYDVVKDSDGGIKVVDDSEEDYYYDFRNPLSLICEDKKSTFEIIDDQYGVIQRMITTK